MDRNADQNSRPDSDRDAETGNYSGARHDDGTQELPDYDADLTQDPDDLTDGSADEFANRDDVPDLGEDSLG